MKGRYPQDCSHSQTGDVDGRRIGKSDTGRTTQHLRCAFYGGDGSRNGVDREPTLTMETVGGARGISDAEVRDPTV